MSRGLRGITTKESFGVVLIIGVLYLILFPVFAQTKNGHRPRCPSRIKQVATSFLIYAGDYDDRYPASTKWMDDLLPITGNELLFICPEIAPKKKGHGYAMNRFLSGANSSKL